MQLTSGFRAVAIATSGILGFGAILFAAFWLLVALGGVPILSGTAASALVVIIAGASVLFGLAAVLTATGLWRRTEWAPLIAGILGGTTILSSGVAVAYSGAQAPILVGLFLGMLLLVSVASARPAAARTSIR